MGQHGLKDVVCMKRTHISMDPYEVLGVPYGSSRAVVRARYLELALVHHPDKGCHWTPTERQEHEETFKRVHMAYNLLVQESRPEHDTANTEDDPNLSSDDWKDVWSHVETIMRDNDTVKSITDFYHRMRETVHTFRRNIPKTHRVNVPVSLMDIHERRWKRTQLFLKGETDPVLLTVDCSYFPSHTYLHTTEDDRLLLIEVFMNVLEHPVYRHDDLLHTHDIFTEVSVSLADYFKGNVVAMPTLDGEGSFDVVLQPCINLNLPLSLEGKGLQGKGRLFVSVTVAFPTVAAYLATDAAKRTCFEGFLESLDQDPCRTDEEPKGI